jgi:hypothetical protein
LAGKVNPDNFAGPTGQLKSRSADSAPEIERARYPPDTRQKVGYAARRVKEGVSRPERIGELILRCTVVKQQILI